MKPTRLTQVLLLTNAILLAGMLVRPIFSPPPVRAQSDAYAVYIEPGYTTLRAPDGSSQQVGKMVIDLRNGNIWGYPTGVQGPYPVDAANTKAPVSHPMYLGNFALVDMDKRN